VRVFVYPADDQACGKFRLIWPALALKAQGHDVTIVGPSKRAGIGGAINEHGVAVEAYAPPDADVIVLQRTSYRPVATAVPLLRAQGVAVVVDMDDDLSCIHPGNPAYEMYNPPPGGRTMHSWRYAADACRDATLVTTASEALQRVYAPHGRGRLLHNCVPESYLSVPHEDSDVIGWGGSMRSHPDDLQTVGVAVARLMQQGHQFRIVGPPDGIRDALRLDVIPEATGSLSIDAWPEGLAGLGVGMAPLSDSRFNLSKSRLKLIEMSALGVPWVASPRAEYKRFHALGQCGLLADNPRQWTSRLRELATNHSQRREMSEAGRALAVHHTIEANAWRWLEAWEDALNLQRSQAARSGATGLVRT
jgi:glycosyltransferase involved in cell wall biosynthesis